MWQLTMYCHWRPQNAVVAFTFTMRHYLIRLESGPFISFRLAKFGWVLFADLRVQRLATKQKLITKSVLCYWNCLIRSKITNSQGWKRKSSPILDYERWAGHGTDPAFGSQPTGDISHKPGARLPLLSTRPVVTYPAKEVTPSPWPVPNYTAWWQRH